MSGRHRFRQSERRQGGRTAAALPYPEFCECGAGPFTSRMSYLGHRGQHGLARSLGEKTGGYWTPGDAGRALSAMGAAWSDPVPANGAYERGRWLLSLFGWK